MKSSSRRKQTVIPFVIVTAGVLLSCITAVFGYDILPDYQDKLFHLRRLAALAQTLKSGYFPARIYFVMNEGTGYAMPVFYPDLFLYIPACLVNAGVPLGIAYEIYVVIINVITAITTYLSVKGILKGNRYISAVISFVYVLSVYRLTDVYIRDAAGEYTAMAFLPFVVYSFIRVYREEGREDGNEKDYTGMLKNAACLGLSMALLALTHVLTTMMAAGFLILCALFLVRRSFRKYEFLTLLFSVLFFLGLSACYLYPMMDYMLSDRYLVNTSSDIMRGFYPGLCDIFEAIPSGSGSGIVYELKMSTAVGPAITAVLLSFVTVGFIRIKRKAHFPKEQIFLFGVMVLSLFMSSRYFPWNGIEKIGGPVRDLLFKVQFSWRYLGIATVCGCILGGLLIEDIYKLSIRPGHMMTLLIMILAIIPAVILQVRACSENRHVRINSGEEIGIVSDELYYPVSWIRDAAYDEEPACAGCEVVSYARYGGDWIVDVRYDSAPSVLVFPVVYYKGYRAWATGGEKLQTVQASDGRVMVLIPEGFSGELKMGFKEPFSWRIAELISLISAGAVIWALNLRKRGGSSH